MNDVPLSDKEIRSDMEKDRAWNEMNERLKHACARRKSRNKRPEKYRAAWFVCNGRAK